MPNKTQQAIRKKEIHETKQAKQRFLFRATYVILFLSLIVWGWSVLRNPNFFPLKQILIRGEYKNTNPETIKLILQPYLNIGLLRLNTKLMQHQLEELPWVRTADLARDWPDKLIIFLTEKMPVARWHKKGLVTADSVVFFPPIITIPKNLPNLITPANLIPQSIILLAQMNQRISVLNLRVKALILTERQTVTLILQDISPASVPPISFKVLLGHDDIQIRLNRFIRVFPKVFENRLNQVQYVDMRYTNGMAVKWKPQQQSNNNNNNNKK